MICNRIDSVKDAANFRVNTKIDQYLRKLTWIVLDNLILLLNVEYCGMRFNNFEESYEIDRNYLCSIYKFTFDLLPIKPIPAKFIDSFHFNRIPPLNKQQQNACSQNYLNISKFFIQNHKLINCRRTIQLAIHSKKSIHSDKKPKYVYHKTMNIVELSFPVGLTQQSGVAAHIAYVVRTTLHRITIHHKQSFCVSLGVSEWVSVYVCLCVMLQELK